MGFMADTKESGNCPLASLPLGELVGKDGMFYLTLHGSDKEGVKASPGKVLAIQLGEKKVMLELPEFTQVVWYKRGKFVPGKDASDSDYRKKKEFYAELTAEREKEEAELKAMEEEEAELKAMEEEPETVNEN